MITILITKDKKMKKIVFTVLVSIICCAFFTGCDDSGQKIGGGGLLQSYDKSNGRYN